MCEDAKDYDEARIYYNMVASSSTAKNRFEGITGLGDIARKSGNISEAKSFYRQAIDESDKYQRSAVFNLIYLECLDENYDEALKLLDFIHDDSFYKKTEHIYILLGQKKYDEALSIALGIDTDDEECNRKKNLLLGEIYQAKGENSKAIECFEICINSGSKDTTYNKAMLEEGKLYFETEEYDMALENALIVYKSNEEFAGDSKLFLGRCYHALGRHKEALEMFHESLQCSLINRKIKGMDCLFIGKINLLLDNYDEALKYLTTCFDLLGSSDNSTLSLIFGLLLNVYVHENDIDKIEDLVNKTSCLASSSEIDEMGIASLYLSLNRGEYLKHTRMSYRTSQIVSYDEDNAVSYIMDHHQNKNARGTKFYPDADIKSLMAELSDKLTPSSMCICTFFDKYSIPYPNAGYDESGKPVCKIGVVTLPGTKNIITMYPEEDKKNLTKGEVKASFAPSKQSCSSSIQKFNSRFAKYSNQANS